MRNKKDIDEYSRYEMSNNLYKILMQYFDEKVEINIYATETEKLKAKAGQENEACKYAIKDLIPITEYCVYNCEEEYMPRYYELWQKGYALAGRRSLEHFIDYMEMDMTAKDKVLGNRRNALKPFIFYLNKIAFDEKLQYIVVSYPPSYGKSYTLNLFSAWCFGLNATNSILRMSYSEELVLVSSRAVQNTIKNPRFADVFPYYKQFGDKPFSKEKESDWIIKGSGTQTSHISRTRDGSVTGTRANKAIILDDMMKGAEEATNDAMHEMYYNKWKTEWYNRKTGNSTKYIFAGTMWSPNDILNRVTSDLEKTHKIRQSRMKGFGKWVWESTDGYCVFIRVPLLDEKDMCTCEAVMSTEEARVVRDTTDPFLYSCVYQQEPIAPTGLEFADDLLKHFEELPLSETGEELCTNYSLAVLDPARRGKDNVSMPIFRTDGSKYYLVDCIFKQKPMTDLYDDIVDKIIEHNIIKFVVENNIDTSLAVLLGTKLKERGFYNCEIIEKYNTVKKEQRIKDQRGLIKKFIYFKDKRMYKPNTDYGRFMKNLTSYSFDYANKHDDAPDSVAMFADQIINDKAKPARPKGINRSKLHI